jgi:2-C-methyl-D-erythritol 2,4-cyclodiphosphate synthase
MIEGLTPARKSPAAPASGEAASGGVAKAPFLIGHGYDIHRLQAGGVLTLAGVVVSNEISCIAHSDGDVVLHAVVDALLGALGLGDIGEFFPNSDPQWKNAASRVFVEDAWRRARQRGYVLGNLDVTVILEQPKLAPHKPAMINALRALFATPGEPPPGVNLKAGTNEGCDAVGRGEAVAAHAVVLLAAES